MLLELVAFFLEQLIRDNLHLEPFAVIIVLILEEILFTEVIHMKLQNTRYTFHNRTRGTHFITKNEVYISQQNMRYTFTNRKGGIHFTTEHPAVNTLFFRFNYKNFD